MIRLNANENILGVYRRHWIIIAMQTLVIILMGICFFASLLMIKKFAGALFAFPFNRVVLWVAVVFCQALWLAFFIKFADFWLDVWVLTNERIIDIEQKGLFKRDIAEFKLDKIQDVSTDVTGIIPTLFRFGNLQIETAGFAKKFIWKTVPNPQNIKNQILRAHDEYIEKERIESKS